MSDATDKEEALIEVERLSQPGMEPIVEEWELEEIVDKHKRASYWVTGTALVYGDVIVPTVRNGHRYRVTVAGTTGATEPTWPLTMTDKVGATPEFEEAGIDYDNVYDIRGAIRAVWALKMARASELVNNSLSGNESAIFDQCKKMAERYARPLLA